MEIIQIVQYTALFILILLVFYFFYSLYSLASKRSIKYVMAKCPEYWTYDSSSGLCENSYTDVSLNWPVNEIISFNPDISFNYDCDKYHYCISNNLVWSGITNNYTLIDKCTADPE